MAEQKKRTMLVVEVSEGERYLLKLMALSKGCSIADIVRKRFLEPIKREAKDLKVPEIRL